jgi:uncharacterized membrane protein (DUF4010 family)
LHAIALSMAQLARSDLASPGSASLAIVLAVASNTLFKAGMVIFLGAPGLRRVIAVATAVILVAAGLAAWWL